MFNSGLEIFLLEDFSETFWRLLLRPKCTKQVGIVELSDRNGLGKPLADSGIFWRLKVLRMLNPSFWLESGEEISLIMRGEEVKEFRLAVDAADADADSKQSMLLAQPLATLDA